LRGYIFLETGFEFAAQKYSSRLLLDQLFVTANKR